jgi:hypothetical protein
MIAKYRGRDKALAAVWNEGIERAQVKSGSGSLSELRHNGP